MLQPVNQNLEDPVTRHMRRDFARLRMDQTIGEALEAIRTKPPEGRIIYFYVVDEMDRLKGVVPTRRLLMNAPERSVGDIMVADVVSIPQVATVLEACEFFISHRLLAFPVVDGDNRLLGIVDVELYTDELNDLDRKAGNDDLFQLIGVHLSDIRQASPFAAFRSRFPWLLTNIGGGILAAFLSGIFEGELQKAVALAMFIPVVLALAESVSIQSVSLALQVLRGKQPTIGAIFATLRRELFTGFFLGLACSLTIATVAMLWLGQMGVVLCLLGGIAGGVTCAAVIGAAMPNFLRYFQRDPQVAAGPIALAATDMVTLLIYFMLARAMFG